MGAPLRGLPGAGGEGAARGIRGSPIQPVPKKDFSPQAIPRFEEAPSVVLIAGDTEFFVEEAATQTRELLAGRDAEVLGFDDDASVESVSDALLNRSLFSPKRVVEMDISRLLGTDSPGRLLTHAIEAWQKGGSARRREAFRYARALLAALGLSAKEAPEELAETAAKRVRKGEQAADLAEILRELPEEKGKPDAIASALRLLLDRGNDGTVALLTATAPPAGVDLLAEIAKKGLLLVTSVGEGAGEALARLARARAKERDVAMDADAIECLSAQTGKRPALFAAELGKLLEWAGAGGRIRAEDVRENVEDESSEDLYALYEAIGRRDAGEALSKLERLFSGREVRAGDRSIDTEEGWPQRFFGMLTGEVRRMLLIRARLENDAGGWDATRSYPAFQARVLSSLEEPVAPFGRSPFETQGGKISPYAWFKAAQRASRYSSRELARALSRAAEVDVKLKSSAPVLETFTVYLGELIAGKP